MRKNARDRFGTPLDQRFTRKQIEIMMLQEGLENISFSNSVPFCVLSGLKLNDRILELSLIFLLNSCTGRRCNVWFCGLNRKW